MSATTPPPEIGPRQEPVQDDQKPSSDLISSLRETRKEVADVFGKTKVLEVPGYKGLLAVEFQYISSEVTENIARSIRRETKSVNGQGSSLLSSLDTLIAASKRVLIRREAQGEWKDKDGNLSPGIKGIDGERPVNFRGTRLAEILNYPATDPREVVLGLYGSEHKIIETNVILSRWMSDMTRTMDEDFLG